MSKLDFNEIEVGDTIELRDRSFTFKGFEKGHELIVVESPRGKVHRVETAKLDIILPDEVELPEEPKAKRVPKKKVRPEPEQEDQETDNDYSQLIADGVQYESVKAMTKAVLQNPDNEGMKNSEIQEKYGFPNAVTLSRMRKELEQGQEEPKAEPKEELEENPFIDMVTTAPIDQISKQLEECAIALEASTMLNRAFIKKFPDSLKASGLKQVDKWEKLLDSILPDADI
jgi:hypothetical protein